MNSDIVILDCVKLKLNFTLSSIICFNVLIKKYNLIGDIKNYLRSHKVNTY